MAPGPIEEGGRVAVAVIDSLKTQPIMLAVLIFNLVLIGLLYVNARELRTTFDRTTSTLLSQQADMSKLLYNCTPIQPTRVEGDH